MRRGSACVIALVALGLVLAHVAWSAEPADLITDLADRIARRVQLSPAEQAWCDAGHTVRVRLAEIPPYHYSIDNQPHGISVDYLRIIFAAFHIEHRFLLWAEGTFGEALARLGSGETHDLMPTIRHTPERDGLALFTQGYITTPWVIFTRDGGAFIGGLSDLQGKTVAVERGYLIADKLAGDYPGIILLPFANSQQAIESVVLGKADAYVGDLSVGTFIVQRYGYTTIKVAAPTEYPPLAQSMALRRDWPELASIIDKSISALTPAEIQEITNKSILARFDDGMRWQVIMPIIASIVLLAGITIWRWSRRLQKEIDERKQAGSDLRASQALLSSIIDNTSDWVWSVDPQRFGLLVFNKSVREYFLREHGVAMVEGAFARQWLPQEAAQRWEGYYRRALESGSFQMEYQTVNGSVFLLLSLDTVYRDGKPAHIVVFGKNITERKRMEELQAGIEAIIRHDLRSPASNAVSLARIMRTEPDFPEKFRLLLGEFEQSGKYMLETLDSSLLLYKIETGNFALEANIQDCLTVINQVVHVLQKISIHKNKTICMLLDGALLTESATCFCRFDEKLLRPAMQNLLCNALEAAPDGSEVQIIVRSGQQCRIEIKNKGVVPDAIRKNFFDKYITGGKTKGTGIGTYSAKMMLEAQGGTVSMQTSDEDNETTVIVLLPGGRSLSGDS